MEASDEGLDEVLEERIKREKSSIEHIKNNLIPKIKKMEDLHYWFHTEHKAYSTHDHNIEIIPEDCKKSY